MVTQPTMLVVSSLPKEYQNKLNKWRKQKRWGQLEASVYQTFKKEGVEYLLLNDLEKAELMCHKLCKFIVENKKFPKSGSKDLQEKNLAHWLSNQKRAANGKGKSKNYPSLQSIVESYGLPDLFAYADKLKEAEEICHKVCLFIIKNNKSPNHSSKNLEEKEFYIWLKNQKAAKRGTGNSVHYPTLQPIAEYYKLHDLFG